MKRLLIMASLVAITLVAVQFFERGDESPPDKAKTEIRAVDQDRYEVTLPEMAAYKQPVMASDIMDDFQLHYLMSVTPDKPVREAPKLYRDYKLPERFAAITNTIKQSELQPDRKPGYERWCMHYTHSIYKLDQDNRDKIKEPPLVLLS